MGFLSGFLKVGVLEKYGLRGLFTNSQYFHGFISLMVFITWFQDVSTLYGVNN